MTNIISSSIIMLSSIFLSCAEGSSRQSSTLPRCSEWKCIEANANKKATVEGYFRKYTPNTQGKGAGVMYWDWELLLADSHAIPVIAANKDLDLAEFENKNVEADATVFSGIIIGSDDPPHAQSASGYRLDVDKIREK